MEAAKRDGDGQGKAADGMGITIVEDGPYLVHGSVPLKKSVITPVGHHYEYRDGEAFETGASYALCRCGRSKNPPFCDGSHAADRFDGTETASREPYVNRSEVFPGPDLELLDDHRCAFARFCHRDAGDVWTLTEESGGRSLQAEAIHASSDCPAGRLTHFDKGTGEFIEPELEPGITILEDPEKGVSAGLYVHGGIPLVSADGTEYEKRNRYALCRCGESRNKPFCDATHVPADYQDGL